MISAFSRTCFENAFRFWLFLNIWKCWKYRKSFQIYRNFCMMMLSFLNFSLIENSVIRAHFSMFFDIDYSSRHFFFDLKRFKQTRSTRSHDFKRFFLFFHDRIFIIQQSHDWNVKIEFSCSMFDHEIFETFSKCCNVWNRSFCSWCIFFFASFQTSFVIITSLLISKQYCTCDNFCFFWNH